MHWFQNLNLRGQVYSFHTLNRQCFKNKHHPTSHSSHFHHTALLSGLWTWHDPSFFQVFALANPSAWNHCPQLLYTWHILVQCHFLGKAFSDHFKSSTPINLSYYPVYFLYNIYPSMDLSCLFIIRLPLQNIRFARAGRLSAAHCLVLSSLHGAQLIIHFHSCEIKMSLHSLHIVIIEITA